MQDNLKEQGEGECYRWNLTLFGPKFGQKLQFFWLPKYVRGVEQEAISGTGVGVGTERPGEVDIPLRTRQW